VKNLVMELKNGQGPLLRIDLSQAMDGGPTNYLLQYVNCIISVVAIVWFDLYC